MTTQSGRSSPAEQLVGLLNVLLEDSDQALAALGLRRPPTAPAYEMRIEPTAYPAIRAIDLRRSTGDDFGIAELELDENAAWPVTELERLLAPLTPVPRLDRGPERLQGIFEPPSRRGWAAVYLELAAGAEAGGKRVTAISVRIEPPQDEDER